MEIQEKTSKSYAGQLLMTFFLFFVLFGLAFGLSIIFLNKNTKETSPDEVIPKAEIKLPKNSATPSPTPVPPSLAKVGEGCKVGGCNSEICLNENDEVATSICIYKEVFACYQSGECKKQDGDKCDWTQTRELTTCIKESEEKPLEGEFCGGIAGTPCPNGYTCQLDGNYPDAGGKCKKN